MQIWDKYRRKEGLLIVLSGPSGVGKDRLLVDFLQDFPEISKCTTVTTREKRPAEVQGCDYTFVAAEDFRQMVEEDYFLEYADIFGNLYGTPKKWVEDRLAAGKDVVLKIDVQGGIAVKKKYPEAVMVFLVPPSLEELERRLRNRRTETDAETSRRLLDARKELECIPEYEYMVTNDSIPEAICTLRSIIVAERSRIRRDNI
jgi:guanylate kinase